MYLLSDEVSVNNYCLIPDNNYASDHLTWCYSHKDKVKIMQ